MKWTGGDRRKPKRKWEGLTEKREKLGPGFRGQGGESKNAYVERIADAKCKKLMWGRGEDRRVLEANWPAGLDNREVQ